MSPGSEDSTTMSAPAISCFSRSRSSASSMSSTTLRFPSAIAAQNNDPSGASSRPATNGGTRLDGEPPGGSILTTSAPRSARMRPVSSPRAVARSITRIPSSAPPVSSVPAMWFLL